MEQNKIKPQRRSEHLTTRTFWLNFLKLYFKDANLIQENETTNKLVLFSTM